MDSCRLGWAVKPQAHFRYTQSSVLQSTVGINKFSETQHSKPCGSHNPLGFTQFLVISGFSVPLTKNSFVVVRFNARSYIEVKYNAYFCVQKKLKCLETTNRQVRSSAIQRPFLYSGYNPRQQEEPPALCGIRNAALITVNPKKTKNHTSSSHHS